jgi:phenylalanyl-tRNA synthetase alpha chain
MQNNNKETGLKQSADCSPEHPAGQDVLGHIHPMSQMIREIYEIFKSIGYDIAFGPELETEYYNFDALNVPADHSSRDMQDTFWLKQTSAEICSPDQPKADLGVKPDPKNPSSEKLLMRTHTSPVQIRYMENHKPPLKVIMPGRVFRNEATDATHEANFFQLEGLCVGTDITMKDLKGLLEYFFEKFFGEEIQVRFRPSFFPFVEPGVEVDVFTKGKWMEVMGAGMVHPKVLAGVGIDPEEFRGFAFGLGLDRFAMIKYGIPDVRMLYQPDLRIFNQF